MKNKLFIAGIPYRTRDNDLKELFENFGVVTEARVVMEKENPSRSRGFGFVTMATEEEAAKAIAEADGAEFDGRVISVRLSEDKPKTEGTGKTFQRRAI
jgi:RNA recognition motif-containing protein